MTPEVQFPVPPRTWRDIDDCTERYLRLVAPETLDTPGATDVERLLDVSIGDTHEVMVYHDPEMRLPYEAVLDPIRMEVALSSATCRGLRERKPRARFTVAHEIGHVLLHLTYIRKHQFNLARASAGAEVKTYMQPEPQANQAAAGLLMPRATFVGEYLRLVECGLQEWEILSSLQNMYQCSEEPVMLRIKWLKKEGFLQ